MSVPRRALAAIAAVIAVFAQGGSAAWAESASARIQIQGTVPVICWHRISGSVLMAQAGAVDLGPVEQFCNSSRGYVFTVQHAPAFQGVFVVNGRAVRPSASGVTVLQRSDAPTARTLSLRVEDLAAGEPAAFSLSMTANL